MTELIRFNLATLKAPSHCKIVICELGLQSEETIYQNSEPAF